MDDPVGERIELGGLAIDDDEAGAVVLGERREARRRVDHELRADGEEQVAAERLLLGAAHGFGLHLLASAGICWPNEIVAVLTRPPQAEQTGRVSSTETASTIGASSQRLPQSRQCA